MTTIDLHIPDRKLIDKLPISTQAGEIKDWVDNLPLANVGETTRLVYKTLVELNSAELPNKSRLNILVLLSPPVGYITESLNKHIIGAPFPLSYKSKKVANLIGNIHSEVTIGYKKIIANLLQEGDSLTNIEILTLAIQRAMRHTGKILLGSYLTYRVAPSLTWKDLHQLYYLAEQRNLLDSPVKNLVEKRLSEASINDVYKHVILLPTTGPSRLSQSQIQILYQEMEAWSSACSIFQGDEFESSNGSFAINLCKDEPPTHLMFNNEFDSETCRLLDTTNLVDLVNEKLPIITRQSRKKKWQAGISTATLKTLTQAWGITPRRKSRRNQSSSKIVITLGLNTTHHFINTDKTIYADQNKASMMDFQSRSQFMSHAIKSPNDKEPDVWNPLFSRNEGSDLQNASLANSSIASFEAPACLVNNESVGGFCLRWQDNSPSNAHVGELVGIGSIDNEAIQQWRIGTIRWMKYTDNDELEFGVQLLAPKADPVATRFFDKDAVYSDYHKSLLVPDIETLHQQASLIVPANMYQSDDIITLNTLEGDKKAQLTELMEETEYFLRFAFTLMNTHPVTEKPADITPTDDLDSFLNSL